MNLEEIRRRLSEVREGLRHLAGQDTLDEQRAAEFDWLDAEERWLAEQEQAVERREERRQDVLRRATEGGRGVEHGDDRGVPNVNTRDSEDPFSLDEMRVSPFDDPERVAEQVRGRALTAIEHVRAISDEHRERMTELVEHHDGCGALASRILQCGSETYERAFAHYLAGRPLDNDEARALSVGTDAAGGFAVPVALDTTIINTSDGSANPLRRIARVETITTATWKGISSSGITVTRKAEAAEATDDFPAIAQPEVTPTRVDAFVPFSFEIDQDWSQLRSELARMIQEAKDDEEATSFVTGDGTGNNPSGVVATLAAGSIVDTATASTFAVDDVYSLDNALPQRFRARAQWLAEKVIYNDVRQFAAADGHDLWERLGGGLPPQMLGYSVNESSAMDNDATTAGQLILLLGDFRHFLIVDRVGMSVELVPHLFGANRRPTGQRGIFAFWRNGSTILADNAFRVLRVAAV